VSKYARLNLSEIPMAKTPFPEPAEPSIATVKVIKNY